MDWETLLLLAGFAFGATWTPGPNNMMLAASGATFGFRATLPHALGVTVGFPAMFFLVALFLGTAFRAFPWLIEAIAWVGAAVMLWLAWRIATARPAGEGKRRSRPFTLAEAAGFQWVNPKAWLMAVGGAPFLSGAAPVAEAGIAAGVFAIAGLTSTHGWAGFGSILARFLGTGWRLRLFNGLMGTLIAASALVMLAEFVT